MGSLLVLGKLCCLEQGRITHMLLTEETFVQFCNWRWTASCHLTWLETRDICQRHTDAVVFGLDRDILERREKMSGTEVTRPLLSYSK